MSADTSQTYCMYYSSDDSYTDISSARQRPSLFRKKYEWKDNNRAGPRMWKSLHLWRQAVHALLTFLSTPKQQRWTNGFWFSLTFKEYAPLFPRHIYSDPFLFRCILSLDGTTLASCNTLKNQLFLTKNVFFNKKIKKAFFSLPSKSEASFFGVMLKYLFIHKLLRCTILLLIIRLF